jgi:hypothetical protein
LSRTIAGAMFGRPQFYLSRLHQITFAPASRMLIQPGMSMAC